MKLPMVVSPATWDLIERLRSELDVGIDVLDRTLAPLLPEGSHPHAEWLRTLPADRSPGGARERLAAAVRSGRHAVFSHEGFRVGLFPIRYHRDVSGVFVAAVPLPATPTATGSEPVPREEADRRVERIGWTLRATLESDIAIWEKLDRAQHTARWSDGVLRFIAYLHSCESDRDLCAAFVQAAAVWGDFEARAYRRVLGGAFVAEPCPDCGGPEIFEATLIDGRTGPVSLTSLAELEEVGWRTAAHEMTLLPVVSAIHEPAWLLAIAGRPAEPLLAAFETITRTIAVRLDQLLLSRCDAACQQLATRLAGAPVGAAATAAALLLELSALLPAGQIRLVLGGDDRTTPRVLAAVGATLFRGNGATDPVTSPCRTPERLVLPLGAGSLPPAWLDVAAAVGGRFSVDDAALAERVGRWLEAWLAGAWRALAHELGTLSVGRSAGSMAARG